MNDSSEWPRYYASVFDYVEIDPSFYRMSNTLMVKNWFKKTLNTLDLQPKFQKS